MKLRLSSADIRCLVPSLREALIGTRLANIYDVDSKTFLLKLGKTGVRKQLLVESGVRIHTTDYAWSKTDGHSGLCMKLRKHLRNTRLNDIRQLGGDRVILLTFGLAEHAHHLILEFYAGGNIVLCDAQFTILALLRTWRHNKNITLQLHGFYDTTLARPFQFSDDDQIAKAITGIAKGKKDSIKNSLLRAFDYGPELTEHCIVNAGVKPNHPSKREDHQPGTDKFKSLLSSFAIVDQWLQNVGNVEAPKGFLIFKTKGEIEYPGHDKLQAAVDSILARRLFNETKEESSEETCSTAGLAADEAEAILNNALLDAALPFAPSQSPQDNVITVPHFDTAIDIHFSRIERESADKKILQETSQVTNKLNKVKDHQRMAVEKLERAISDELRKGELVFGNAELVERCIKTVAAALKRGMQWKHIEEALKESRDQGDLLGETIASVNFKKNMVTVALTDPNYDSESEGDEDLEREEEVDEKAAQDEDSSEIDNIDSEESEEPVVMKANPKAKLNHKDTGSSKTTLVEVDLRLSAQANARMHFDASREATRKREISEKAAKEVMAQAEKKTNKKLAEMNKRPVFREARKLFWFERFNYVVSSDNYLILGGKDSMQSDLLVQRYMDVDAGDVYVCSGTAKPYSMVIKNNRKGMRWWGNGYGIQERLWVFLSCQVKANLTPAAIPRRTLEEAAAAAVFRSVAWKEKISTEPWYVNASQVVRLGRSGVKKAALGNFSVKGQKIPLPSPPLVAAFGLLFVLEQQSVAAHANERKPMGDEWGEENYFRPEKTDADVEDETAVAEEEADATKDDSAGLEPPSLPEVEIGETAPESPMEEDEVSSSSDDETFETDSMMTDLSMTSSKAANVQQMRGKKGKKKKLKNKYKDQSDSEREEVLTVLQSGNSKVTLQERRKRHKEKLALKKRRPGAEEVEVREVIATEPIAISCFSCGKKGHMSKDCPYRNAKDIKPEGELLPLSNEINLAPLRLLTFTPRSTDKVVAVLPMMVPYTASNGFIYRFKVVPGVLKKGKAAHTLRELAFRQAEKDKIGYTGENDCLQILTENEILMQLTGTVSILNVKGMDKKQTGASQGPKRAAKPQQQKKASNKKK